MDIETKTLNYLKSVTAETISNAKSGHTGSALGGSSILLALFKNHLHFDPTGTNWKNRDRFILSAGHVSSLLYNLYHLFGYDITTQDLKDFRKYGSKTPGHPEYGVVPGVETTTGPLGQGVANAVGFAIGEAKMNAICPTLFNHYTYCYAGDGCLMEGVAVEACSLAGKLALNKLILLYDDNGITLDGEKEISNNENTTKKFEAMGWNVIEVQKGNDYHECVKAIGKAKQSTNKPTIIIFKTIIGIGTYKQGTCGAHGYPLSAEELSSFKKSLNVTGSFEYPEDVIKFCRESTDANLKLAQDWNKIYETYKDELNQKLKVNLECNFKDVLKVLNNTSEMAGRDASNVALNELAKYYYFFGGTADLSSSTKAFIKGSPDFEKDHKNGQNIYFGIREHAMGSIANGIALYGDFYSFDSTFVSFSNYMFPSLRMRAMMQIPALSIFTHDSVNIGEDGPTHQPIEQISQMREFVGLSVFRPATYAEVVAGYKYFLTGKKPTVLALTKTKISNPKISTLEKAEKGAYIIYETGKNPQIEIFATGTEVYLAMEVADKLSSLGVRVISVPNEKLFASQTASYKSKVLLPNPILKVAIEATNDNVWYKYIGTDGVLINIDSYQHSGNGQEVYEKAGFNAENVVSKIKKALKVK